MSFYIFFVSFLAVLVFLSYIIVPRFFRQISVDKLWGGISDPRARALYMVSIFLAALAFLIVYSYFITRDPGNTALFWSLAGFLFFSILWMPSVYLSLRYPPPNGVYKYLSALILGLVAFCALYVFFILFQTYQDRSLFHMFSIIAAGYLLFHTLFLDFILYTIADIV